jgi:hypothetical protein
LIGGLSSTPLDSRSFPLAPSVAYAQGSACAVPSFAAPATLSGAADYPNAVAGADFDGDGHVDLVETNSAISGPIHIRYGVGDGTFGATSSITGIPYPGAVAVGDFNGDGHADLAVANYDIGVSILLSTGREFVAAPFISLGTTATGIVTGDFNGDGKLDFAASRYFSRTVEVFIGDGAGNFSRTGEQPTGAAPSYGLAAADFNGDGHLDVVAVSFGGTSNVSVFPGSASGALGPRVPVSAGSYPRQVAVGDFNQDGAVDFAVATTDSTKVFRGTGSGGFTGPTNLSTNGWPYAIAAADVNGDGLLDLAVGQSNGQVAVFRGQSGGGFAPAVYFSGGPTAYYLTIADFNGDGRPDIAVADWNQQLSAASAGASQRR